MIKKRIIRLHFTELQLQLGIATNSILIRKCSLSK